MRQSPRTPLPACLAHGGLLVCAALVMSGCVSVSVEHLTHVTYAPRTNGTPVQSLDTEPNVPFSKLARIVATSDSADEEQLREKILARAGTLGADAVVMGKFDILESMGPSPLYESTLGPTANSYSPYLGSWGGWSPFYYDPWSFVQSDADQVERTEYLSGMAIRYVNDE